MRREPLSITHDPEQVFVGERVYDLVQEILEGRDLRVHRRKWLGEVTSGLICEGAHVLVGPSAIVVAGPDGRVGRIVRTFMLDNPDCFERAADRVVEVGLELDARIRNLTGEY